MSSQTIFIRTFAPFTLMQTTATFYDRSELGNEQSGHGKLLGLVRRSISGITINRRGSVLVMDARLAILQHIVYLHAMLVRYHNQANTLWNPHPREKR
jgi:hypothetical protein